ncbi:MAG: DoxX family protein, partial [Gammaproteobacteria bacterium]
MRIVSVGHALFAATMIALGILGVIKGDFAPIWNSVPEGMPAREALAYVCAMIALGCGIGLLWQRASAARVLFIFLLLWMLLIKARYIVLAPMQEVSYQSCGETA